MASRDPSSAPRENFFARTLDRAISLVSPEAGLQRAMARHGLREFSAYDAANKGTRRVPPT